MILPVVVYIMAAHSNASRCSLLTNCFIVVFVSLICFVSLVTSQSSTPTSATTSNDSSTSETPPTSTPGTTQAPTTTTTPAPTQPPSQIPANTDIGTCPCDLTGNACDVNCCCDTDCSADDRLSFSQCLPFSYSVDDRLCLQEQVILLENSPYFSNVTSDNLFCIYIDNRAQRNFYYNPSLVSTDATFNKYVADYGSFTFQPQASPVPTSYPDYYQSGDSIYTVFPTQAQGKLGLPESLSSTFCADGNPMAYLLDESHDCVRLLSNLATECTSVLALSANTYYQGFRVVTTPALFQRYTPVNDSLRNDTIYLQSLNTAAVDLSGVTDVYNNTYTVAVELDPVLCEGPDGVVSPCGVTTPPVPAWDAVGLQCNNTVAGVSYRIIHNGTSGIVSVFAQLTLANIPAANQRFTQRFSSSFRGLSEADPPPLSGVAIQAISRGRHSWLEQEILLNSNRDEWLTLVRASANGNCITDTSRDRVSVQFKDDARSGCFIQISMENVTNNCEMIQQAIINAMEGSTAPVYDPATGAYPATDRYVAIFGNSDVKKVGDWTPHLGTEPTYSQCSKLLASQGLLKRLGILMYSWNPATGSNCFLSLGMHIQVLYAYVGSLVNPQPKIIGISFLYDAPQSVFFRCEGPYCQPGSTLTQKIEISSSVSFIDVSQPAIPYEAERPVFLAKVPYDFFYPFLDSASPRHQGDITLLAYCFVSVLVWRLYIKL
ncbi:tectonic-3-like [Haliotis rubra]|uniref:tectonic-3-like n=1 Tax=Haliotis rubra TaxID=36100 RepID=UPI001EE607FB|nr:tectonic-3-like [Haliotis rubra]